MILGGASQSLASLGVCGTFRGPNSFPALPRRDCRKRMALCFRAESHRRSAGGWLNRLAIHSKTSFQALYKEAAEKIGRFNLAIFGKTGVGKSTPINEILVRLLPKTGIGDRTGHSRSSPLHSQEWGLGLLDTRGVEIGVDTGDDYRRSSSSSPISVYCRSHQ